MSAVGMTSSPAMASLRQQAGTWWAARTPRERQAVVLVGLIVGLYVVWSLLVAPALRTVTEAPARIDKLDGQYQQMQRIATESTALRAAPRVSPQQAQQALKAATDRLGDRARLALLGDRATVSLTNITPEALRAWLSEARSGARVRPTEANLTRNAQGYSGTIGLALGGGQ